MALPMTPEQLAATGTEEGIQRAFFCAVNPYRTAHPALDLLHSVPNGDERTAQAAARLKATGVKAGIPDVCLPVGRCGFHGLYIEFKRTSKAKVSADQIAVINALRREGHMVLVTDNWETALTTVLMYLSESRIVMRSADGLGRTLWRCTWPAPLGLLLP